MTLEGKEKRLLEKRIEELTQERDAALAERETLAAEWGLTQIHLQKARAVVRSADRFCRCLGEFVGELGPQGISYCSESMEALETALLDYSVYEAEKALEVE